MNTIVTGASRGIGLELASQALSKGHHVLAVARAPESSPELKRLQAEGNGQCEIATVDLALPQAAEQIAAAVAAWPQVDVLINNAGVYKKGETPEDFQTSFQINSVVPFLVTRALMPKLKAAPNPKVAQITSLMGSIADNQSGKSYAYRASKAALNMITKTLAQDESWLISVVIHPGWVKTRMGGPGAITPVQESASGIWRIIDRIQAADSGSFFDFEGDHLPW